MCLHIFYFVFCILLNFRPDDDLNTDRNILLKNKIIVGYLFCAIIAVPQCSNRTINYTMLFNENSKTHNRRIQQLGGLNSSYLQ